jgi:hypothetical protein
MAIGVCGATAVGSLSVRVYSGRSTFGAALANSMRSKVRATAKQPEARTAKMTAVSSTGGQPGVDSREFARRTRATMM